MLLRRLVLCFLVLEQRRFGLLLSLAGSDSTWVSRWFGFPGLPFCSYLSWNLDLPTVFARRVRFDGPMLALADAYSSLNSAD